MSFKAVYDAKDMRSTGGGDVNYAIDFAPTDSTLVQPHARRGRDHLRAGAQLRIQRRQRRSGRRAKVERPTVGQGGARETWGGMTCNPYDTDARDRRLERRLGRVGRGEPRRVLDLRNDRRLVPQSGAASTASSTFVPTKGMISYGGGIGANPYQRSARHPLPQRQGCGNRTRCVPRSRRPGYFDARDLYTALPRVDRVEDAVRRARSAIPSTAKPLAGMRIGVIRELMVKINPSDAAVSDGINRELKVLQRSAPKSSSRPTRGYPDDPAIPNMELSFEQAIAEIVPFHMPEVLVVAEGWQARVRGAGLRRDEPRVPGAAASLHKAPWPANLELPPRSSATAERDRRRERLRIQLQVRPVPAAARRRARARLGDAERQREVQQRYPPRRDEELGEQGHRHPHGRRGLHHETSRRRCAWSMMKVLAAERASTCS